MGLYLLVLVAASLTAGTRAEEVETVAMLDAMMQLMLGPGAGEFDRGYLAQLTQCMDTLDPELASTSDGAWRGIITYHDTDGAGRRTHSPDLNPIYKRTCKVQN